jgi:Leucine-rich repeat (LRR) protein
MENIEVLVAKIPNLERLDLDSTGTVSLPPGLFYNNARLKRLNVSNNYLIHLDASVINELDMLEVLDLSSNSFMGIEQSFFDVLKRKSRLQMVYLQVFFKNILRRN